MISTASMTECIESQPGYYTDLRLRAEELSDLQAGIREAWLARINEVAPEQVEEFRVLAIERYHEKAHLINHESTWNKMARVLPEKAVKQLLSFSVMAALREEFGDFLIADEEGLGFENVTWRLVRPGNNSDVGPLHADAWFYTLSKTPMPVGYECVKVWIAVYCEVNQTGFRLVPNSHLQDWSYTTFDRDGRIKPLLQTKEEDLDVRIMPTEPGDAVVFNHRLLHGGVPGSGTKTRVSIDFTLHVPIKS